MLFSRVIQSRLATLISIVCSTYYVYFYHVYIEYNPNGNMAMSISSDIKIANCVVSNTI